MHLLFTANCKDKLAVHKHVELVTRGVLINIMTSVSKPSKSNMTSEEKRDLETEEMRRGPMSILSDAVKTKSQVLISCRSNKKLLCTVRAFDRHFNMVLENVREMWTEKPQPNKGKKTRPVQRDRYMSKVFLRGDCVILVVKNPTL